VGNAPLQSQLVGTGAVWLKLFSAMMVQLQKVLKFYSCLVFILFKVPFRRFYGCFLMVFSSFSIEPLVPKSRADVISS
jgi:hypothetical protein